MHAPRATRYRNEGPAHERCRHHALRPFLKWPGGKRWLLSEIASVLPPQYNHYIEPFLGGAALFFHLRAWPASLSDINEGLINAYRQVRDNVDELVSRLSRLAISRSVFDRMRSQRPRLPVTKAVRFLYLNRTAFNGLYRVNRNGEFNVPFGCKPGTVLCDTESLHRASKALQNRKLSVREFEEAIDEATDGDLVYADPPYTSRHNNNGFRRYNERIFSWLDQERLAAACRKAADRGANVIVSNANHAELIRLYEGFRTLQLKRQSAMSATLSGRGKVTECLFYHVRGHSPF